MVVVLVKSWDTGKSRNYKGAKGSGAKAEK